LTGDPPIRPTSTSRCPKRQRHNRGGKPLTKRPEPVQTNRATSGRISYAEKCLHPQALANSCQLAEWPLSLGRQLIPRLHACFQQEHSIDADQMDQVRLAL
jgi:hypothetical protein